MIASSMWSPPTRIEREVTMPEHVGGAAADVDDHVAGRGGDVEAGADRRGHRLLDQVDLARAGRERRLLDRALLHARDAGRHADHDTRPHQAAAVVRLADEVAEHRLRHLEVRDHAILDRADRADRLRRPAQHLLGLVAHREHPVAAPVGLRRHRDHARLRAHDPLRAREHECVGGAEVDGQVVGEHPCDRVEEHGAGPSRWELRIEDPMPASSAIAIQN
jgi:hypothetical protein